MALTPTDITLMARALRLAERGLYTTTPNPRVGCVLSRDGRVIAEGWHRRAGGAHAEINALQNAGTAAAGATAYVTLEPCSHSGKTGPCSEALIRAGVARVVYAMEDPNPAVSGAGLERLRGAGIAVAGPLLEDSARDLNPGFVKRMERGLPYVCCKLAMSLDGRTAMASGESKWVTGPKARSDVQRLRARSCAVVTGIGTVAGDDAALTVRAKELNIADAETVAARQPLRVVVDSTLRLSPQAKVLQGPGKVLIAAAQAQRAEELEASGAEIALFERRGEGIDLRALLAELARRQCNEVLVEAGATLAGAFLRQGLLDELIVYMAPKLLGSAARPLFELPLESMAAQLPLRISDIRAVGQDWRITAKPDPEG
ncbi:bifunctional diaminohydroxyphosphoribosylaminopyrimidine deaminase/5-amino-6-(5-phosphoribosylamino)uracil reductase RibD [Exilibacterium tricleocarpae]|uniref:Riboflavin biosynthesis protein RibD n=1 Tax=Exilibacterium tricleocarpae TaxID=2591008 RepID=A0A545SPP8_9GAMM|nr:bifunctional diaminohydroxyphosphoribosylaminopyrimidine deaminase/5-amino-6-(5-phosphoribosylamino)uracil reductase RibD [Exilibacterium tricleocarpae]TQV66960.1 bifunctional diaminohydroxyphosphoribosylaminopyrimidine deaminase/5-amino-6-(5-phosphoribosylamino)uracil reductase RibD [Exilibacterium tricleocarpae]